MRVLRKALIAIALVAVVVVALFRCCAAEAERDRFRDALLQMERDIKGSGHADALKRIADRLSEVLEVLERGHEPGRDGQD